MFSQASVILFTGRGRVAGKRACVAGVGHAWQEWGMRGRSGACVAGVGHTWQGGWGMAPVEACMAGGEYAW